jgi:hypothetical protein
MLPALAGLVLSSCEKKEALALPEFDRAVFEEIVGDDLVSSEIGHEECVELRKVFRSASVDENPAKWQTYGHLSLYGGRTLLMRFRPFQDSESISAFSYGGEHYRGYDQRLFRSLNWKMRAGIHPEELKAPNPSKETGSFSSTTPFSESYNLPPP